MSKTTIAIDSERTSSTSSSSATTGTMTPTTATKLCHLIKRVDFEGYGFNLHSEKSKPGQYIGKVDSNSPAEHSGLLEGERIIEVNGVNIGNETHKQVVQRIKALSGEVRLLLITAANAATAASATGPVNQLNANINTKAMSLTPTTTIAGSKTNSSGINSNEAINGNGDVIETSASNGTSNQQQQTTTTPPPPSSVNVMSVKQQQQHDHSSNIKTIINNNNNPLQLPITAAEMRAKLLAKKKYDPKNEAVDLKKKYEIIQKL